MIKIHLKSEEHKSIISETGKENIEIWRHLSKNGFLFNEYTLVVDEPYRIFKVLCYQVGDRYFFKIKIIWENKNGFREFYETHTSVRLYLEQRNELYDKVNKDKKRIKKEKENKLDFNDIKEYKDFANIIDLMTPMQFMYYAIEKAMNREYIEMENTQKRYKPISQRGKSSKRKEYKLFDVIRKYNQHINHNRHFITCEKWEVKGHFRHYKNGKVVYVKPYEKGKGRKKDREYVL